MKPDLPDQILARRKFWLRVSILVAGVSTIAVPGVVMAERHIFGQEPIAHRLTVMAIAAVAYTASYVSVRIRFLIAESASFIVTTALAMTLVSGIFAILITIFSGWNEPSLNVLYVRYFLAFVGLPAQAFWQWLFATPLRSEKKLQLSERSWESSRPSVCPECLVGSAACLTS